MPPKKPMASKRKRSTASDRPPPVPPPPAALLSLLKSNKLVLQYFTSLQANVDADVQKWKVQANKYKAECVELQAKLDHASIVSTPTTSFNEPKISQKSSPMKRAKEVKEFEKIKGFEEVKEVEEVKMPIAKQGAVPMQQSKSTEINDSIFDDMLNELSSDDDDDDDDDDHSIFDEPLQQKEKSNSFSLMLSSDEEEEVSIPQANSKQAYVPSTMVLRLRQARDNLLQLGVALTETKATSEETVNSSTLCRTVKMTDEHEYEHDENHTPRPVHIRRSDQDVITDIFFTVHSLAKIQNASKDHQPFSLDDLVPCSDVQSHPAYQGKHLVFEALITMDAYCDVLGDHEWELLFHKEDEQLSVGMKNRKELVHRLMESLNGEIADHWPFADRSTRVTTSALHFDPDKVVEPNLDAKTNKGFGSKSKGRISWLAERCLLAQLLVRLFIHRRESQEAASLVIRYLDASAPSIGQSEYPKYPPVLSICVVEAMICCDTPYFFVLFELYPQLLKAVSIIIRTSASIWMERLKSADDRITDGARVEIASYQRLMQAEKGWLGDDEPTTIQACRFQLENHIDHLHDTAITSHMPHEAFLVADQLQLVLKGDLDFICDRMEKEITDMSGHVVEKQILMTRVVTFDRTMTSCTWACRQLLIRRLERYRQFQGGIEPLNEGAKVINLLHNLLEVTMEYGSREDRSDQICWLLVACAMQACANLVDGEKAHKLIAFILPFHLPKNHKLCRTLLAAGHMPIVRVINLERRSDRWSTFISQALQERLLVVRAVARLDSDDLWGNYAFDGIGRALHANQHLSTMIGRPLNELVEARWKPMDLLAFDYEARKDDALVPMSPSERACALSHLCSWKGVQRSLENLPALGDPVTQQLLRLYRISGFASGPPLLQTNEAMPPVPVCVILEDDAILVDRFVDRLEALLAELPRDFHFCSIGYSRPRTAPMVELSSQLGIPTCLWYLTGYILSLEGATHLLNALPIVGPVDSWIGLRMTANWDNTYGEQVGVGVHAQQNTKTPSRKELGTICKFRAFAALVPLCNQKTHLQKVEGVSGRNWRQRDTDITFSGR